MRYYLYIGTLEYRFPDFQDETLVIFQKIQIKKIVEKLIARKQIHTV